MMVNEEGYIKFSADWEKGPPPDAGFLSDMIAVRSELFRRRLIGQYPDGIGYGNISKRWDAAGRFVISGTATGGVEPLTAAHFTLVTETDVPRNRVCCTGPILASSESMSHAAIYRARPEVNGVIHLHDIGLWTRWKDRAPTTSDSIPYGTPEMALAIGRLEMREWKFFVMGGHREGCISFGKDLWEALEVILSLPE